MALTLSAKAASLSAAGCLVGQGARRPPISSTLLMSALSLAALRKRLACTWGVGGRQGMTAVAMGGCTGKSGGAGALGRGLLLVRAPWLSHWPRGRSLESLVTVVMVVVPPSLGIVERKLLALCVTNPSRQTACAAAESALRRKLETLLGAARLVAAVLARLSTSLLARQSTVVSSWPSLFLATPLARCDL